MTNQTSVQHHAQIFEKNDWVYSQAFSIGQLFLTKDKTRGLDEIIMRLDEIEEFPFGVDFGIVHNSVTRTEHYTEQGQFSRYHTSYKDIIKITPITTLDQIKVGSMVCHSDFRVGVVTFVYEGEDTDTITIRYVYRTQVITNYTFGDNHLFLIQY